MSLNFYSENEDNFKEESINNYKDLFIEYLDNPPRLPDALNQMFISSGATEEKSEELIKDLKSKTDSILKQNGEKIKSKYPNINTDDIKIISSYTCESKEKKFSPYRILNTSLVAQNRKQGINCISKYLYILLNSLRKLERFYPNEKSKFLYRCITSKVNINNDKFNPKLVPYITGNTKTFWGFTSTSPDVKMTYDFLKGEENNKSGTIFTLSGKVWGYDITLFNYFSENEILLEPERKFIVEQVLPPVNGIIYIRCDIQDNPLVLSDIDKRVEKNEIIEKEKDYSIQLLEEIPEHCDYVYKYVALGDSGVNKKEILEKFTNQKGSSEYYTKAINYKNKVYKLEIWDTVSGVKFKFARKIYYKDSHCIIIVYDITNKESFDNVPKYIEEIKSFNNNSATIILVGNKCELDKERKVTFSDGKSLADNYGIKFYEVSYISGKNVNEIFIGSIKEILKTTIKKLSDLSEKFKEDAQNYESYKKECIIY